MYRISDLYFLLTYLILANETQEGLGENPGLLTDSQSSVLSSAMHLMCNDLVFYFHWRVRGKREGRRKV